MIRHLDPTILRASKALLSQSISAQQAVVLSACATDRPPNMTDLSRLCGVTTASMTGTIERMIALGWVKRTYDETDRRVINVVLTDAGQNKIDSLNNAISTL